MFYRCKPVRRLAVEVKTASKIACRKIGKEAVSIEWCLKHDRRFFDILLETLRKMDTRFAYHLEVHKFRLGEPREVAWEDIPHYDTNYLSVFAVRENPHVNYRELEACYNVYKGMR